VSVDTVVSGGRHGEEQAVVNELSAGWYPDPMRRHELRYWTPAGWSEHVSDGGRSGVDPVSSAPPQATYQQPAAYQQPTPTAYQQPTPTAYQQPTAQPPIAYQQPTAPFGTATPAVPRANIGVAALVGAVIGGLSAPLSWIDAGNSSVNGFDVPAAVLVDYTTNSDSGFSVGLLVLVLAAAALLSAFVRQPATRLAARVAGSGLIAVGAVYVVQLYRAADRSGASLSDVMGLAPFVAIIGGVVVTVAARH
jgi:hypothetical protein